LASDRLSQYKAIAPYVVEKPTKINNLTLPESEAILYQNYENLIS
jgi:hypothetical protein